LNADAKPPGGLACGSFGLSRGSVLNPFEPRTANAGEEEYEDAQAEAAEAARWAVRLVARTKELNPTAVSEPNQHNANHLSSSRRRRRSTLRTACFSTEGEMPSGSIKGAYFAIRKRVTTQPHRSHAVCPPQRPSAEAIVRARTTSVELTVPCAAFR